MLIVRNPGWASVQSSVVLVGALALLLFLAPALAGPAQASAAASTPASAACMGPPCGYITPLIDMEFPSKIRCSPQQVDLSKCTPLPADGESITYTGTVRWYWKLSEDLTYPQTDPNAPVILSFAGSGTNPKYLTFKADPPQYTIDEAATFNPQNMKIDQTNPSSPIVYYWFERSLNLTITRHGDPTSTELASIANHNWIQTFLIKAKSTANDPYFKESFGVTSFGFNATGLRPVEATKASPAWGLAAPATALALAVSTRRRRA